MADPVKPTTPAPAPANSSASDPLLKTIQAHFEEHSKLKQANADLQAKVHQLETQLATKGDATAMQTRVAQLEQYMRAVAGQLNQVAGPGK